MDLHSKILIKTIESIITFLNYTSAVRKYIKKLLPMAITINFERLLFFFFFLQVTSTNCHLLYSKKEHIVYLLVSFILNLYTGLWLV
jgi:hypothetical protein